MYQNRSDENTTYYTQIIKHSAMKSMPYEVVYNKEGKCIKKCENLTKSYIIW